MFHITPTPTSWMIWAVIWAASFILTVILVVLSFSLFNKDKIIAGRISAFVIVLIWIITLGTSFSSGYYNYTHSADYIESKKTYKQNYDTKNQHRELTVKNYTGKVIYHYDGSFKFSRSGHGLNLVNVDSGKKVSVYIGDNDSVTVVDK